MSGGEIVDGSYRNMFHDPVALAAERLLLETVVSELVDHEGVWMWNLGNEPDLFARPQTHEAGRAWAHRMTDVVREIDGRRPVTTGLHAASLFDRNGLRVHDVFACSDVPVMHGYPMYVPWADSPLDPDFVPFLCALTSALTGKPTLAEEWGGCTAPAGEPSTTWEWTSYGRRRSQYMASEEELAEYVERTLPRLVEVGAIGSVLWCFSDYSPDLWGRPPCEDSGAKHERHFGLMRPDGLLKPHADVLRRFAATKPLVMPATRTVDLGSSADDFYTGPLGHAQRLYRIFQDQGTDEP